MWHSAIRMGPLCKRCPPLITSRDYQHILICEIATNSTLKLIMKSYCHHSLIEITFYLKSFHSVKEMKTDDQTIKLKKIILDAPRCPQLRLRIFFFLVVWDKFFALLEAISDAFEDDLHPAIQGFKMGLPEDGSHWVFGHAASHGLA